MQFSRGAFRLTRSASAVMRRDIHTNSWNLPVSPGGTLKVRLPKKCSVRIFPLDPHKHDWTQSKVDMHILGETDESFLSEESAKQVAANFNATVVSDVEPGRNFLQVEAPADSTPTWFARNLHLLRAWIGGPFRGDKPDFDARVVFHVGIPGRFDLDVELEDGLVTMDDTIEGDVKIHSISADVHIEKLKSMYVDVDVDDGDIVANVVQGNLTVRSNSGHVDVGRAQGPCVRVASATGDVQMRALYADYAMLRSRDGAVRLGSAQGYVKVRTVAGDVEVAGTEGRLDVETDAGDVEANLSSPKSVSLRSRYGDIALGIPDAMRGRVLVEGGSSVDIDEAVGLQKVIRDKHNGIVSGEVAMPNGREDDEGSWASVHARAPSGDVWVARRSWAETIYSPRSSERERFPRWAADGA